PLLCGLSPYHCLDYMFPRREQTTVRLESWTPILETTEDRLAQAREVAVLLQERARPLAPLAGHPLAVIRREEWSPAWAEDTLELVTSLGKLAADVAAATQDLLELIKWTQPQATGLQLARLLALAESLVAAEPVG